MAGRKQLEQIIILLDKRYRVIYHGGKTATIEGKRFPIDAVRKATQKRFVQRVIRRHKETVNGNGTELSARPAIDPQAAGPNQDGSDREDQGS